MTLQLVQLEAHPNEIAATKVDGCVSDGAFFLDFTRPLEQVRWCGMRNRWLGPTVGLFVPVVHEGEANGGFVVGVDRSEPHFSQIRALWRARYPESRPGPSTKADGLKIIADFGTQFPDDSS